MASRNISHHQHRYRHHQHHPTPPKNNKITSRQEHNKTKHRSFMLNKLPEARHRKQRRMLRDSAPHSTPSSLPIPNRAPQGSFTSTIPPSRPVFRFRRRGKPVACTRHARPRFSSSSSSSSCPAAVPSFSFLRWHSGSGSGSAWSCSWLASLFLDELLAGLWPHVGVHHVAHVDVVLGVAS